MEYICGGEGREKPPKSYFQLWFRESQLNPCYARDSAVYRHKPHIILLLYSGDRSVYCVHVSLLFFSFFLTTTIVLLFYLFFFSDNEFCYWRGRRVQRRLHTPASGPRPFSRSIPVGPPGKGLPNPTARTTLLNLRRRGVCRILLLCRNYSCIVIIILHFNRVM